MRSAFFFLALLLGHALSVNAQKSHRGKVTQLSKPQGICGTVLVKRGNYMPDPDQPQPNPNGRPAQRDVLVFPILKMDQVTMTDNGFITDLKSYKPVKTVKSDKQGKFCINKLPAGTYTVLVREPKGLYANLSDSDGHINPVTVNPKKITTTTIVISHQAVF